MSPLALIAMWAGLGVLMVALSVPLVLGRVPRNPFYGFRTPKTLSSDAIWYRANQYGGRALARAGAAIVVGSLVMLLFAPWMSLDLAAYLGLAVTIIPLAIATGASIRYASRL